jgi:hypothetical protein
MIQPLPVAFNHDILASTIDSESNDIGGRGSSSSSGISSIGGSAGRPTSVVVAAVALGNHGIFL